jgi:cysteine synthase A
MANIIKSFDELIGNTPLMELTNIKKEYNFGGNIFAKLEFFNPAGSVKDRVALSMINDAEQKGLLKKGGTVIEPTSGNTGIGLAAVCTARGYKAIIVMPDTMSVERIKLIKAFGAEIVLTDGKNGMKGAIQEAERLNREIEGSIIAGQFENPANPKAHFETTGPEIYNDLDGKIDVFVAGVGTGGTLSGIGKFLKQKNSDIKIVAVEPLSSPVLTKGESGSHKIQGIGAGFVPKNLDTDIYDEVIAVSDDESFEYARKICKTEGLSVGISSGAALCGAVQIALREENKNKNIVVLLPDTGSRYLSTDLV